MLKHTRAMRSHFGANEQDKYATVSQTLQSSENGLWHTRAAEMHLEAKDQAQTLNSSEKCLQHTRALLAHFDAKEQAKPRQSSEKCRWHTSLRFLCFL
jgi:hypothetical protein